MMEDLFSLLSIEQFTLPLGMNPDDLPVPPAVTRPGEAKQGKILTILDDEHQLVEFPTQAELA